MVEYNNGDYIVTACCMLKQEGTAGSTDLDEDAVNLAMFKMKDEPGVMRWWWHTHPKMGVFWSGTDTETIDKLAEGGYVVATVFNDKKRVEVCC